MVGGEVEEPLPCISIEFMVKKKLKLGFLSNQVAWLDPFHSKSQVYIYCDLGHDTNPNHDSCDSVNDSNDTSVIWE